MGAVVRLADIPGRLGHCLVCRGRGRHASGGPCFTCQGRPERPVPRRPCVLSLTAVKGSNGKKLRVRCECMSGVDPRKRVDPRTPYDDLGEVDTIAAARELHTTHQEARHDR